MRLVFRNLRDSLILNLAIMAMSLVFRLMKLIDARFKKATVAFTATYQFRAGHSAMRLIFDRGKIKSRGGKCASPDFEIRFIDLPGALAYMAKYPNDPITLIMENKIEQIGNLYFLYKFGYLCGLCETFVSSLRRKHFSSEV